MGYILIPKTSFMLYLIVEISLKNYFFYHFDNIQLLTTNQLALINHKLELRVGVHA